MSYFRRVSCAVIAVSMTMTAYADVILPGQKGVSHHLVFEELDNLRSQRLVAAPILGSGGVVEIEPRKPFRFSTKYGTRFYVIPLDVKALPRFNRELYSKWPSARPPIREMNWVPISSGVKSITTTLRLVGVDETGPVLEVVDHVEYQESLIAPLALLAIIFMMGICICIYVFRKTRRGGTSAHRPLEMESS